MLSDGYRPAVDLSSYYINLIAMRHCDQPSVCPCVDFKALTVFESFIQVKEAYTSKVKVLHLKFLSFLLISYVSSAFDVRAH